MAQKIRVSTALELDGEVYNITIAPVTKKTAKKIQKAFNKEKEASQAYIDLETKLMDINSDIELNQELLDATEDLGEKRALILEKRDLIASTKELKKQVEDGRASTMEKMVEAQEKMYETMFDEMASGDDVEKLKAYVSEYSFEVAVEKLSAVYGEELKGK